MVVRRTLFHAWQLAAVVLLVLAILVTFARSGMPWVQAQRQAVLGYLLRDTPLQAGVDTLGIGWRDAGPVITVQGLHLAPQPAAGVPAVGWQLQVQHAEFAIRPWYSLLAQRLQLGEARFSGVTVQLDSRWLQQQSAQPASTPTDWQPLARLLLEQVDAVVFDNTALQLLTDHTVLSTLRIEQLHWQNDGQHHDGEGWLAFDHPGVASRLQLITHLEGAGSAPAQLAGQVFIQTRPGLLPARTANLHGDADFRLWLTRAAGQWQLIQLQPGENRLHWHAEGRAQSVALRGGTVQWKASPAGWQLLTDGLQVQRDNGAWQPWQMQLDREGARLDGVLDPVSLQAVAPALALLSGEHSLTDNWLRHLQPHGLLDNIRLQHQLGSDDWQLTTRLQQVSWQQWDKLPGVAQLDGDLRLTPHEGRLALQMGEQTLRVGPLFPADIPLQQASATLQWQQTPTGWSLSSEAVEVKTPVLHSQGQFTLTLPAQASPHLSLLASIDLQDAGQAWRYYPRLAMGQPLVDYLTAALQKGQVDGATLLWNGPLDEFPYHDGGGVFQVAVPLRHARFQFDPAWQPLDDLSLDLLFHNDELEMRSQQARLGQAHSGRIFAWFPTLAEDSALYINADVEGEAAAVQDYLRHSGVADSVGAAMKALPITKPLTGQLQLVIPLSGDPVKVLGNVHFNQNRLQVAALGLPLEQVTGDLWFSDQETHFSNLTAKLWGQPLTLDYQGQQQADGYQVNLGMRGRWRSGDSLLPAALQQTLQGATNWHGKLDLRVHPGGVDYNGQWQSDLQGLALQVPAPYGKLASERRPLHVGLSGNLQQAQLSGDWAPGWRLQADWSTDKQRFSRFWLGNQDLLPGGTEWSPAHLELLLPQLDADAWQAWWQALPRQVTEGADLLGHWLPAEQSLHLSTDTLTWAAQPWHQVQIAANAQVHGLRWQLSADEAQGEIRQFDDQPLDVDLRALHWRTATPAITTTTPMPSLAAQREILAGWPALNFNCQRCQFNTMQLGHVNAQITPTAQGVEIPHFSLQQGKNRLTGAAQWLITNDQSRSALHLRLDAADMESGMKALGYAPSLGGTKAHGEASLRWQGPLYRLDWPTLEGETRFETAEGLLRNIDSPSARVLSLFSLHSIVRRLNLDFRDLFEKGLFFRKLGFTGKISDGVWHNSDLLLQADAGDLRGAGQLSLPNGAIDYQMRFTPQFTNGLSLATAFAVTPVTGVYVLAASRLLSPVIDVITEIRFQVSGTLDQPKINETGRIFSPFKAASSAAAATK